MKRNSVSIRATLLARTARRHAAEQWVEADNDLRDLLTCRQEATLVLLGVLD